MNGSSVRRRAVVHGRVQGVFFRDSCRREAELRQLTGWVRNLADGTVEAVFEGELPVVLAMIDWLHDGPPAARVDQVVVTEEPATGEPDFRVK